MCLVIHLVSLQVYNALYKCYGNNLVTTLVMTDTDVGYITWFCYRFCHYFDQFNARLVG
jgi:hypothetical protein